MTTKDQITLPEPDIYVSGLGNAWGAKANPAMANEPDKEHCYTADTVRRLIAEAIEAYKIKLLDRVGEPVAWLEAAIKDAEDRGCARERERMKQVRDFEAKELFGARVLVAELQAENAQLRDQNTANMSSCRGIISGLEREIQNQYRCIESHAKITRKAEDDLAELRAKR